MATSRLQDEVGEFAERALAAARLALVEHRAPHR
jgi:hypothetical protein